MESTIGQDSSFHGENGNSYTRFVLYILTNWRTKYVGSFNYNLIILF